ncbi:MAG: Ig-like domain-containing protein [Burkholderiaceae bacterium]|nr:Ig-like domain-containing protein [Burkholderiaceae bacterium]
MRYLQLLATLILAALITACGGGGGSAGTVSGSAAPQPSTGPVPASVEILASDTRLSSAPGSTVSFTVTVKDAANQSIPTQTVTFSASSGNLLGVLPAARTGASGEPITTVSLSPGSDQTNRDITVTAYAGGASRSIVIPVFGTSVSITGDGSVLSGGVATYTVKAQDGNGKSIAGASLSIKSSLGNNLSQNAVTTDASGVATFLYTANIAGADVLTVEGLGASGKASITVSAEDFRFSSPSAGSTVQVGVSQPLVLRYLSGGVGVAGRAVTFSTTRGSISPSSGVTDANGQVAATISSTTSGPANVIAQLAGGAQANLSLVFAATTPASLVVQANPGAVLPNALGSSINQSALQATVRDSVGNPVPGRVVNFTALTDGSNGTISPGSGTTDANGIVSVQFIPGALSTANNGVIVQASVQSTAVTGTTGLTVSGQALFISIATGNVITNLNPTTYEKEFTVYVTDANGAPAANRAVSMSASPSSDNKGSMTFSTGSGSASVWVANISASCANEDVNRNGTLDAGEDTNRDGRLTPGLPVVVSPSSITTDGSGFATFKLRYGENYAPWLTALITARATVGGTESSSSFSYTIGGAASDFSDQANPPAGVYSPFGTSYSCTDAL